MPKLSRRKSLQRTLPTRISFEIQKKLQPNKDNSETESDFECSICGQLFYKQSILGAHIRISHEVETDFNFCEDCNEEFSSSNDRDTHCCRAHLNPGFPLVKCKQCGKYYHLSDQREHECYKEVELFSFSTDMVNSTALNHISSAGTYATTTDNKHEINAKIKNESEYRIQTDDFEGIECNECGKLLRSHASLALHKKTHCTATEYYHHTEVNFLRKEKLSGFSQVKTI